MTSEYGQNGDNQNGDRQNDDMSKRWQTVNSVTARTSSRILYCGHSAQYSRLVCICKYNNRRHAGFFWHETDNNLLLSLPCTCRHHVAILTDDIWWILTYHFRSTSKLYYRWQLSVRPSVRPSVHKSFFDFDEIWYTGSTRWEMKKK